MKEDFKYIAILSAIILAIGVYLVATTALISKDGVLYINFAKQFTIQKPVNAVKEITVAPGYPFLIYLFHKIVPTGTHKDSFEWIVSAQSATLSSKLIASIALYFVGSFLIGRKEAFWGVLILSVLPDSAEYGSDALTEWPHLIFLSIGFLLLLLGSQYRKSWLFGLAGIMAGLGFLIRTECCQLLIYGGAWLVLNLIIPKEKMSRTKVFSALILLTAGFAVIAFPYMKIKGYIFPDQQILMLPSSVSVNSNDINFMQVSKSYENLSLCKTMGNKTIIKNVCETLVYYFVPGLVIGGFYFFGKRTKTQQQNFYITAFIILNIAILLWQLYFRKLSVLNFLSRRHTLTLIAFTVFFIPLGIEIIAGWIRERTSKFRLTSQQWFYILSMVGISICLFKIFLHTMTQKDGYRNASLWLEQNTALTDVIAVTDSRIAFYAGRNGIEYSPEDIPDEANYIVKIIKNESANVQENGFEEKYSTQIDRKNKTKIVIYKKSSMN